ncbi:MAG: N-acetyltransferase, partial [Candidatus Cloacimonetes bacterium]|nr:N-acetyltransferase [Candidatus Cloacimonadota bacterium]
LLTYMVNSELFKDNVWTFHESSICNVDYEKAEEFDKKFPSKEKKIQYSQEDFWISAHSFLED